MKRFLSLVLALVMTMSLVTIASAKDFTDADAIAYSEAVDVVSAVGIIDGYTDGSFNPQGGLTRGAAAKIICNLILGPTTAENLIADAAPYSDVPTSNVFAGYIAYCQKEGIISGYADGTFKPAASLTGFAFMKMLLGALGYDAKLEGYTGNNWSINVAKQALALGLEEGLEGTFNGAKALTREEACLYAFNTLKATMVEYDETTNIVIGDIQINTSSSEKEVANKKTSYWDTAIGTTGAQDDTMEFCEKYFGDLKLDSTSAAARDGFGRPANYWTLEGEDIGVYAKASADKDVSRGYNQVGALLNSSSYLDYDSTDFASSWTLYINGATGAGVTTTVPTPKGAVIETFKNPQGKVTDVVVYWYDYAKIDAIETDLTADAKKQGATAYIDLVNLAGGVIGSYYDAYDNGTQPVLNGYTDKYVDETVLAVCFNGSAIVDSYIPASYTGVPTAAQAPTYKASTDIYFYEGYVTIGGNKYEYAGNVNNIGAVDFESEYTVFVNKEGYAYAIDGATALQVDDLYYITGVYGSTTKGATVYTAQAVSLAYGTEKEFVLENTDALATGALTFNNAVAGLYSLSDKTTTAGAKANDGKWNATAYVGSTAGGDKYDVTYGPLTADVKSDAFKVDYTNTVPTTPVAAKSYINDETVFISIDGESASLKSKYGKGSMQMQSGTNVIVFEEKDSNEAVLVIYVGTNLQGVVDTEDVVYLAGAAKVAVSTGYQTTLRYMKDMSSKTVVLDGRYARGFYTYSVNDDNTVTLNPLAALAAPMTIASDDDMTTGYVLDVQALNQRNQRLTGATSLVSGVSFDDVSFAKATVIDTRNSGDRDQDAYKQEVKSPAGLAAAIDKKGGDASMDVYVVDGQIVFACVYAMGGELLTAADLNLPTSFDGALQLNNAYYATANPTYMTFALKNVSGAAIDYVSYHNYMVDSNGYVANSQVMYGGFNRTVANNGTYTANGSAPVGILAAADGKYVDGTYDLYSWIQTATGEKYGTVTTVTISGSTVTVPFVLPTSVDVTLPVGTYAGTMTGTGTKGLGWRTNAGNANGTYITLENNTGADLPLTPYNVVIKDASGNTVVSRLDVAPTNPANAAGAMTAWSTGASLAALGEGVFTVWAWGVGSDGETTYGNLGFTISTVHEHSYASAWSSDATNHWHACSCGDKKDVAAHIPGPAATATTPQKCTECEYVIAPALGVVIPAGVPASLDVTLPVGTYASTVAAKGLGWRSNTANTNAIYITLTNNTGAAVNIKPYNIIVVDSTGNEVVNRSGANQVNPSNPANAAGAVTSWNTGKALSVFGSGTYTVYAWGVGVDDGKTYGNLGFEITFP